ncbi:unnamed protein product, partial [Phaeothamnion confervicola]
SITSPTASHISSLTCASVLGRNERVDAADFGNVSGTTAFCSPTPGRPESPHDDHSAGGAPAPALAVLRETSSGGSNDVDEPPRACSARSEGEQGEDTHDIVEGGGDGGGSNTRSFRSASSRRSFFSDGRRVASEKREQIAADSWRSQPVADKRRRAGFGSAAGSEIGRSVDGKGDRSSCASAYGIETDAAGIGDGGGNSVDTGSVIRPGLSIWSTGSAGERTASGLSHDDFDENDGDGGVGGGNGASPRRDRSTSSVGNATLRSARGPSIAGSNASSMGRGHRQRNASADGDGHVNTASSSRRHVDDGFRTNNGNGGSYARLGDDMSERRGGTNVGDCQSAGSGGHRNDSDEDIHSAVSHVSREASRPPRSSRQRGTSSAADSTKRQRATLDSAAMSCRASRDEDTRIDPGGGGSIDTGSMASSGGR